MIRPSDHVQQQREGGSLILREADPGHQTFWAGEGVIFSDLALSSDDKYLGAVLSKTGPRNIDDMIWRRVAVFDVESGNSVLDVRALWPIAIRFVEGRKAIAVLSRDVIANRTSLTVYGIDSKALPLSIDCDCDTRTFTDCFLGVSHDGDHLALWTLDRSQKEEFSAWETETGKSVAFNPGDYVWSGGEISPNGELLAHGGWPGPGIRISRAQLEADGYRECVAFCLRDHGEFSYKHDSPAAISFSQDSNRFLVVYRDGTLIDWTISSGPQPRAVQIGNEGAFQNCTSVAVSHVGTRVFYAINDGLIRAMNVAVK
jgi:hypothetical protein